MFKGVKTNYNVLTFLNSEFGERTENEIDADADEEDDFIEVRRPKSRKKEGEKKRRTYRK